VNAEQATKLIMQEPTQLLSGEGRSRWSSNERISSIDPVGVVATACRHSGSDATREAPAVIVGKDQLATRESQAGPSGVTERLAVLCRTERRNES
jgi:hypothetical protein